MLLVFQVLLDRDRQIQLTKRLVKMTNNTLISGIFIRTILRLSEDYYEKQRDHFKCCIPKMMFVTVKV